MDKKLIEELREIQRKEPIGLLDYFFLPSQAWKWVAGFVVGFLFRLDHGLVDAFLSGSLVAGAVMFFLYYRDYKIYYIRYPKELGEKSLIAKLIKLLT